MTDSQQKNVLIVSVDQGFITNISNVLQGAGLAVLLAHDEATLAEAFGKVIPDLLIIDIGAGGENNIGILETIRAQSNTRIASLPVIAASETGDLVQVAAAIKLGVRDYLVKTMLNSEQLLQKIAKQLPLAPVASSTEDPVSTSTAAATKPLTQIKLLIVEDDKFLRDLAVQKISKEGLNVIAAVDGEQGVAFAEKEIPDIILLDILLPGIDGFEVLRRVRANPTLAKTKIAMLSNFGQREDIERALDAGADQFMVKANYTLDEIVEEVKKIVATPR